MYRRVSTSCYVSNVWCCGWHKAGTESYIRGKIDLVMLTYLIAAMVNHIYMGFRLVLWYLTPRHFQQYFSYIVAVSFIGEGNWKIRRKALTCCKSLTKLLYISPWSRFELTTSVVIGTDCIGSCKSSYHTITAPDYLHGINTNYHTYRFC